MIEASDDIHVLDSGRVIAGRVTSRRISWHDRPGRWRF